MGSLYIVSTPIGNMEDITLRALRILGEVDVVLCEDTRKTGMLLQHHDITRRPQLLSFYEENEEPRIPQIISLLKTNKKVALVSNAGTPLLSDPGYKLVRSAIQEAIKIEAIPGPSALLTALVSSGMPMDKFLFLGFLPKKPSKLQKIFEQIKCFESITVVLYESPYRLVKTLKLLQDTFGEIDIAVGRELTKLHEEIFRSQVSEAISYFEKKPVKGELTVILRT